MSYVYLLKHADLPLFKIGLSETPYQRIIQIGRNAFNLSQSCVIKTLGLSSASRLERALHLLYHAERRNDSLLPKSGFTEWFCVSVYDEALSFIKRHASSFNVASILPAEKEIARSSTPKHYLSGEELKQKRHLNQSRSRACQKYGYFLLWSYFRKVSCRLAGFFDNSQDSFYLIDDWIYLLTPTDYNLFSSDDHHFSRIHVHASQNQNLFKNDKPNSIDFGPIPRRICFQTPKLSDWISILHDQFIESNFCCYKLADIKNKSLENQMYVCALASQFTEINNFLTNTLPPMDFSPCTLPTDCYSFADI